MVRLNDIIELVLSYNPKADVSLIQKAYVFSAKVHEGQVRLSGEPYLSHPLEVAHILAEMKLDVVCMAAGLMHDVVEDTHATLEDIKEVLGTEVAVIVDGVTKITQLRFANREERAGETIRKMIVAMANDIRVLLVKIADRLHNMRTLGYLPEAKQRDIARETLDIYAPLAGRLGLGNKKSQLEDLAFYYLETDSYRQIRQGIAQQEAEQRKIIEDIKKIISEQLSENNIEGEVQGRVKHIYSIYRKMLAQNININQVFDLIAFRIVVDNIRSCYQTLGMIHSLWKPIPGRFKDYVAVPKANRYQSLHTTVVGPYGQRMEIQIRTQEMHLIAEEGIAAHWKYKEGGAQQQNEGERFAWLRSLLDWQRDMEHPSEFLESLRMDLYQDEVYVFTPNGQVVEMPGDATPLDFAYKIHTDIGHTCVGAKVNGKLVPLKSQLKNGDIIEILTNPKATPSKDWLKIARTPKARAKIRRWVRDEERIRSVTLGKDLLDKELRKKQSSLSRVVKEGKLQPIAEEFSLKTQEDLYAALGYGKVSPRQVVNKLIPKEIEEEGEETFFERTVRKLKHRDNGGILVKGIQDVLIRMAKCCTPLPGDPITGFITRGRGVTVHRSDCPHLLNSDTERWVEVRWDSEGDQSVHPIRLELIADDRQGLLGIISNVFAKNEANITRVSINTTEDKKAICDFTVEVRDKKHLDRLISSLKKVKEVMQVTRVH
jgi:guanosine-3',5'-bis(diphosphate) 3'-pyrophosphohydrolase